MFLLVTEFLNVLVAAVIVTGVEMSAVLAKVRAVVAVMFAGAEISAVPAKVAV